MKKIIFILASLLLSGTAMAQDYTFTNHNVVPYNLNPSLAGNANAMRFGLDYRMQWPTLKNKYNTIRLTYDQNFYRQIGSVGVSYVHDNQAGVIKNNEFSAVYSHNIRLQDGYYVRLGVQGSFMYNVLDDDLIFDDQYMREGVIMPTSQEQLESYKTAFLDFSVGAAFVVENLLTVGASIYHIAEPNNGFNDEEANYLGRRYVFHANYLHDLESRAGLWGRRSLSSSYVFGSLSYQQQDFVANNVKYAYKQLYAGVGAMMAPVLFGISYKHDFNDVYSRLNTVSFMVGASYKGFQAYYIYDLYTSKKGNGSWSHELSFIYVLPDRHYKYSCPIIYW